MSKKVIDTLDPATRKELQESSTAINNELAAGNGAAEKAARHYISAGLLMNKVKLELGSDIKFGQWRSENLNCSANSSRRYMQVASKYGELGVDLPCPSITLLGEMASAPAEVRKELEGKLKAGEKVTVKDARDAKKEEYKRERVVGAGDSTGKQTPPIDEGIKPDKVMTAAQQERYAKEHKDDNMTVEQREAALLLLDPKERMKESDNPWNVLGLTNFFENPPSPETLTLLVEALREEYSDNGAMLDKIEWAVNELN